MLQQESDFISFTARINRLKAILFVTFVVGFITGIPSAVIPGLQANTYGANSFQITGGIAAAKGVLAFVYNPLVGSLSDVFGRRRCLMVTLTASIIPYLAMTCTSSFWVFAIADIFFGVYGVSLTLLMALVADVIPAKSGVRTEGFALALAVFMLAVGGSTFVGMSFTTLMTFTMCTGAQTAVLILAYFIIPDKSAGARAAPTASMPVHDGPKAPLLVASAAAKEDPASIQQADEAAPRRPVLSWVLQKEVVHRVLDAIKTHRNLRFLTAIIFWNYLTQETLEQLLLLYLQNTLNLNSSDQAYVISFMSLASLICLTVVITYMRKYFGTVGTLRLALLANFMLSMLYAFATTTWQAMAIPSLSLVGMAVYPCTCAIAAASVTDENSGLVQGIATGARVIAGALCPGLFGLLFQATQNTTLPGAPFIVGAVCVLVALFFSRFVDDVESPEERANVV